jgi:class 3 adenylate cyclase
MPDIDTRDERLQAARAALEAHEWRLVFELLEALDASEPLGADDLERLAKAAWWVGRPKEAIAARERAYREYVRAGDRRRAGFAALTLRRQYQAQLSASIATGWLTRAERLLEDEPEAPEHGYLAIAHGGLAWNRGELGHALTHMDRGIEIGTRFGEDDLQAWARTYRGMILIAEGAIEEGLTLIDEVSAAAAGGELGGFTTGGVFCNTISVYRDLADYRRGGEWAELATRWCERQDITGFPGVCRIHRVEIMRRQGAWLEADQEVRRACAELHDFHPAFAGSAFHELGELRLRIGDLEGADDAFGQAHQLGTDPQPGLALLQLAQGKVEAAASSIRRSLEETTWDRLARARILPAQIEIARAAGDLATARSAAEELAVIASEFSTAAIRASSEGASGTIALLENDADAAVRGLRRASQLWREVGAPYEAAATSLLLAEAHLAEGDRDAAELELRSAQATFERLGARPDERRAAASLERLASRDGAPRAVRTFMFTDVVGSTALIEAIGDEAWERLKRWHDDTLRSCFAEHGGEEVDDAGDGFFIAFADSRSALTCAVSVQRRLAEHRHDHGFAPEVRIGLHTTEATRSVEGYLGGGVHAAARIGALATGGEILASAETVQGAPADVSVSDPRAASLKGFAEPVSVVSIDWR